MNINIRYVCSFIMVLNSVSIVHASNEEKTPRTKYFKYVCDGPEEYLSHKDQKLEVTGHVDRFETWSALKNRFICTLCNNSLILATPISLIWQEHIWEDKDYVPSAFFNQQNEKPKIFVCKENT